MSLIWKDIEGTLTAVNVDEFGNEEPATWAPQPGSQEAFLNCPYFECLYEGTRGPGKTDALIMDFGQHVGQGFGEEWVGVVFRQTFPQLGDIIAKSLKWFPKIWPQAKYNIANHTWTWPTGERFMFRPFLTPKDYDDYHGHAYPWIGWEELTRYKDDKCYKVMMSCCRSTVKGIPLKYRSTTNPYGAGHNWVKARFKLPVRPGKIVGQVISMGKEDTAGLDISPEAAAAMVGRKRVAIRGRLEENKILLHAQSDYAMTNVVNAARNPSELAAWLHGDWNVTSGGLFDDLWRDEIHVIPDIDYTQIPRSWKFDRAYDHGQSKPHSVGWWLESSGESIIVDGTRIGAVKGDLIRVYEWYGWNGNRNEGIHMNAGAIAGGIIDREKEWNIHGHVKPGPADLSIFDPYDGSKSVASDMAAAGVRWTKSDKGPNSRSQGWQQIRTLLEGAVPHADGTRDKPGIFVCGRCDQFREVFPGLPRDEDKQDDSPKDAEDHIPDEVRYRVRRRNMQISSGSF